MHTTPGAKTDEPGVRAENHTSPVVKKLHSLFLTDFLLICLCQAERAAARVRTRITGDSLLLLCFISEASYLYYLCSGCEEGTGEQPRSVLIQSL